MTSARTKCGAKGTVNRWGTPCKSTFISKETGLCRSHDPSQVNRVQAARSRGGHRSRSTRLSRRMQKLVEMLFSDAQAAPTLERIEPREVNPSNYTHILKVEGRTAVLDGYGPHGFHCANHYRCQDDSLFAKAMRLLRIVESVEDGRTIYAHVDTGTIIPQSEIDKIVKLVRER